MKVASLFSGIGGFEKGLIQADTNTEIVFSSEIDKYARQTYKKNFGVDPHGDITQIKATDIPDHDILCGGFPCQSFSIAGKRRGFEDCRGTLFFEIMRIAQVKRPSILFLENVRGILSHAAGRTFKTVLRTMDDMGYDAEWQVFNSKNHGVPQNRERVFIIGHLRGTPGREIFPITKECGEVQKTPNGKHICTGTLTTRNQSGQANWDGSTTLIACDSGTGHKTQLRSEIIAPLRANNGAPYNNIVIPNIAGCLTGGGHSGGLHSDMTTLITHGNMRRLTPIECERLQGFPDNWTEGVSDTQRYKQLGNAVTVNVIEFIARRLFKMVELNK